MEPRPHTCFDYERVGKSATVCAVSIAAVIAGFYFRNMVIVAIAAPVAICAGLVTLLYLDGNPYSRKRAKPEPPSPATEEQRYRNVMGA